MAGSLCLTMSEAKGRGVAIPVPGITGGEIFEGRYMPDAMMYGRFRMRSVYLEWTDAAGAVRKALLGAADADTLLANIETARAGRGVRVAPAAAAAAGS